MRLFAAALALALADSPAGGPGTAAADAGAAHTPEEAAARLAGADALAAAGDLDGAARVCETLAAGGWEGPSLFVTLGNARLRLGRRGAAIAAYERALRLDPGDEAARANLELARAANLDRPGTSDSLAARLERRAPDSATAASLAAAWTALWIALAFRRRARRRWRPLFSALALAAALVSAAGGAVVAAKALDRRTPEAIVVVPSAPAREGTSPLLRPAFEVHEGTRLRILEARGDLARVQLESGLEGWVARAALEGI